MQKPTKKPLRLATTHVRVLTRNALTSVNGGFTIPPPQTDLNNMCWDKLDKE